MLAPGQCYDDAVKIKEFTTLRRPKNKKRSKFGRRLTSLIIGINLEKSKK